MGYIELFGTIWLYQIISSNMGHIELFGVIEPYQVIWKQGKNILVAK